MTTQLDWQRAMTEALQACLENSLTAPMPVSQLGEIFGLGFRQTKAHLNEIEGVVRAGSYYRIPLKMMPPEFIKEMRDC